MKYYCKNSFELVNILFNKETDPRKWGELEGFFHTNIYQKYFGEMQDKYVRGKGILEQYCSEYQDYKTNCMSAFIDYIDKRFKFPLWYSYEIADWGGNWTTFTVNFETDNQLSIDFDI